MANAILHFMASTSQPLERVRADIRNLLDVQATADALAAYYALHAPTQQVKVVAHYEGSQPDGFLVSARTGMDLFRPLVTFRAQHAWAAQWLFREGLTPGRPVYLTVPQAFGPWVNKLLQVSEVELHRVYRLRADRHEALLNVLALTSQDANGAPRVEIRPQGELGAVAGLNWQSPNFSEIYVYTDPAVRGRGWGKAVVSILSGLVLKTGRTPLYVVAESNDYSIRLAEAVGFEDTGTREFVANAVLPA